MISGFTNVSVFFFPGKHWFCFKWSKSSSVTVGGNYTAVKKAEHVNITIRGSKSSNSSETMSDNVRIFLNTYHRNSFDVRNDANGLNSISIAMNIFTTVIIVQLSDPWRNGYFPFGV